MSKPCHERWDDMHVVERGRFCASCQKTVVDYSLLSDQELIKLLSKSSETTCGRFHDDQLNRPLVPANQRSTSVWRNWVSLLTLSLVSWQSAWAQLYSTNQSPQPASTQQPPERPSYAVHPIVRQTVNESNANWVISGRVMAADSNGTLSPVPEIDVFVNGILSVQIREKWQAKTDSSGLFHLVVPRQEQTAKLKIWSFSDKYLFKAIQFDASPVTSTISVGDIIMRRMPPVRKITSGGICVIQTPSRWQQIKRKLFRQ